MQRLNSIKIFLICLRVVQETLNLMQSATLLHNLSFIIKGNTIENIKMREIENDMLAKKKKTMVEYLNQKYKTPWMMLLK